VRKQTRLSVFTRFRSLNAPGQAASDKPEPGLIGVNQQQTPTGFDWAIQGQEVASKIRCITVLPAVIAQWTCFRGLFTV
jgi:hypothetical protein